MSPTPRRQPMIRCPHCNAENDPARGSTRCVSCGLPLNPAGAVYEQAIDEAAQILTDARAHLATLTPRRAAEEAHVPGGPSVDELETRFRALRDQTRHATRAA